MSWIGKLIRTLHSSEAVAEIQTYFGLERANKHSADKLGLANSNSECGQDDTHSERRKYDISSTELTNNSTNNTTHRPRPSNSTATSNNIIISSKFAQEKEANKSENEVVIKNKMWYYLFCFGAELGNEYFYLTFYPFFMWNFSPWILRRAVYVWVVVMYIGQTAKEIIKMPRPSCPPAFKMEKRYETEYGMPSTHAMVGLIMPFTILLTSIGRFEYPYLLGLSLAIFWTSIVVGSRIYLGMHSLLDIIAGITASTVMMTLMLPFLDSIDSWVLHNSWSPLVILLLVLVTTLTFPKSKQWRATHADTVNITSIASGIAIGSWINANNGMLIEYTGSLPYVLSIPSLFMVGIMVLRLAVGIPVLVVLDEVLTTSIRKIIARILGVPVNATTKKLPLIQLPQRFGAYFTMSVFCVSVSPMTFQYLGIDPSGPYMDL